MCFERHYINSALLDRFSFLFPIDWDRIDFRFHRYSKRLDDVYTPTLTCRNGCAYVEEEIRRMRRLVPPQDFGSKGIPGPRHYYFDEVVGSHCVLFHSTSEIAYMGTGLDLRITNAAKNLLVLNKILFKIVCVDASKVDFNEKFNGEHILEILKEMNHRYRLECTELLTWRGHHYKCRLIIESLWGRGIVRTVIIMLSKHTCHAKCRRRLHMIPIRGRWQRRIWSLDRISFRAQVEIWGC